MLCGVAAGLLALLASSPQLAAASVRLAKSATSFITISISKRVRSNPPFGNGRRDPRSSYNGNLFLGFNNSVWDAKTFSVTVRDTRENKTLTASKTVTAKDPVEVCRRLCP